MAIERKQNLEKTNTQKWRCVQKKGKFHDINQAYHQDLAF